MAVLDLPQELESLVAREWARLASPGCKFTGTQRVAIAAAARGADVAQPGSILAAAFTAANKIYGEPASITQAWMTELGASGLSPTEYVEILGIVARLRALDTMLFGLGHPQRPLPRPADGEPNHLSVDATVNGAWVPTVGPASPPTVLSSIPAENDAMHDLHAEMYLAATADADGFAMGNLGVVRDGLSRSQMEFVAARTSLLNDCFF